MTYQDQADKKKRGYEVSSVLQKSLPVSKTFIAPKQSILHAYILMN